MRLHPRTCILLLLLLVSPVAGCLGGSDRTGEADQATVVLDRVDAPHSASAKPTVIPEETMQGFPAPFRKAAEALRAEGSAEARLLRAEVNLIYARIGELAESQGSSRSLLSYRDVLFQIAMLSH